MNMIQEGYTGIKARGDVLWFDPCLPDELGRLRMQIRYRRHDLSVEITPEKLKIAARRAKEIPIKIGYKDEVHLLEQGKTLKIELNR